MSADKITPEQLREDANNASAIYPAQAAKRFRGYAAALEENAALREQLAKAQRERNALDEALRERDKQVINLCEQLAERDAENSKLRSALEIVHFKREPWQ